MRKNLRIRIILLVSFFVFGAASSLYAQEEIVVVTAAGHGGTPEQALDQAIYHAVVITVEKHFASQKDYAAQKDNIRQFVKDNVSDFVGDLENVKIIKKYRRKKITARIPLREADLIAAVQNEFPDLVP